jgi:hypothetical protein
LRWVSILFLKVVKAGRFLILIQWPLPFTDSISPKCTIMKKSLLLISVLLAGSLSAYFPPKPVARGSRPIEKTIDHD